MKQWNPSRLNRIEPFPRITPLPWSSIKWPVKREITLPNFQSPPSIGFSEVVESRRSLRQLYPPSFKEVLRCITYATRAREEKVGDPFLRTRRLSPSAGALHPIETIILFRHLPLRIFRYDSNSHALQELNILNKHLVVSFLRHARKILPEANGCFIILLANIGKTAAIYKNHTSLIWRDAGALLQTLHLCATAFNLGFSPMGILGTDIAESLFSRSKSISAVGVACIGKNKRVN